MSWMLIAENQLKILFPIDGGSISSLEGVILTDIQNPYHLEDNIKRLFPYQFEKSGISNIKNLKISRMFRFFD